MRLRIQPSSFKVFWGRVSAIRVICKKLPSPSKEARIRIDSRVLKSGFDNVAIQTLFTPTSTKWSSYLAIG
jgi:hypothetical protein